MIIDGFKIRWRYHDVPAMSIYRPSWELSVSNGKVAFSERFDENVDKKEAERQHVMRLISRAKEICV